MLLMIINTTMEMIIDKMMINMAMMKIIHLMKKIYQMMATNLIIQTAWLKNMKEKDLLYQKTDIHTIVVRIPQPHICVPNTDIVSMIARRSW